jgi:hypothetical protein
MDSPSASVHGPSARGPNGLGPSGRGPSGRERGAGEPSARRRGARGVAAVALLAIVACATPDAPPLFDEGLPRAALDLLRPDTLRSVRVAPGVVYRYAWSAVGPWAVHLVQADLRGRCELAFDVLRPDARRDGGSGRDRVTTMAGRSDREVLVAVNADFFTPEGDVVGAEITDGVVTSASRRPAIAWRPGSAPWIGAPTVDADSLHLGWAVSRRLGDGRTEAVGGFPELLDAGRRVGDLEVAARPDFAAARHPRTAVGYDPARGWAWIVVVDGRQTPYSDGMTLPELARLFEALGAAEAVNLDGGGSSVMVLDARAVSRPSDITGERPVVNALALRQDPAACAVNGPR